MHRTTKLSHSGSYYPFYSHPGSVKNYILPFIDEEKVFSRSFGIPVDEALSE
jgi:hypothetical protein